MSTHSKDTLLRQLNMTKHVEGGYFTEVHRDAATMATDRTGGNRNVSTSIFYMLTEDRPIGTFHRNKSTIVHYFQLGSPLTYYVIHPSSGQLEVTKLGPDLERGHRLQLTVPGSCWKATELEEGEFGLLGESVAPGFDFRDMEIGQVESLVEAYPQHEAVIRRLCKGADEGINSANKGINGAQVEEVVSDEEK